MPRVGVVIPNWNGAHHLGECIDALARQTFTDFITVVVDNGSTDGSVELVQARYPWVTIVALGENRGFSAAVNRGIEQTDTELIALLNNDTRADENWLERFVAALDGHPDASFAACKMLRYDPPHLIDSVGDRFSLFLGAGANIGAGASSDDYASPAWVFGACAGAALYRRSLFDDIGGFDEDFFLIFEDVDIDMRAQVAGHDCRYVPDAVVYHKRGASTDPLSEAISARAVRNAVWVAGKSLPMPLLIIWTLCFSVRMIRVFARRGADRVRFRLFPRTAPAARGLVPADKLPAPTIQSGAVVSYYVPELLHALRALPTKRRATAPLRRTGSMKLLRVLLRTHRVQRA